MTGPNPADRANGETSTGIRAELQGRHSEYIGDRGGETDGPNGVQLTASLGVQSRVFIAASMYGEISLGLLQDFATRPGEARVSKEEVAGVLQVYDYIFGPTGKTRENGEPLLSIRAGQESAFNEACQAIWEKYKTTPELLDNLREQLGRDKLWALLVADQIAEDGPNPKYRNSDGQLSELKIARIDLDGVAETYEPLIAINDPAVQDLTARITRAREALKKFSTSEG